MTDPTPGVVPIRHDGLAKLAAFTRLAETGDIEEGSVLALAIENSPWFQRRIAAAAHVEWSRGFHYGRNPDHEVVANPHPRPDTPVLPAAPVAA